MKEPPFFSVKNKKAKLFLRNLSMVLLYIA
jgi:hypothetical protein